MRTPGPIDPSLRLVDAGADRGAGPKAGVRVGAFVFVEVRERLGGELYRVSVGGRLLTAASPSPLEPGSTLRARVERSPEGTALRLVGDRSPAAEQGGQNLAGPGSPGDLVSRMAAAALLREGIAPEARALARVRRAFLREPESGSGELASMMEAKLMPAEDGALTELLSLTSGGGGGRGDEGGGAAGGGGQTPERGGASPSSAGPEPLDPPDELDRDFSLEFSEEELPRFLARLFRAMATRVGEGGEALSLFNHLRGPEGSWVLVPFRFDVDAVAFKGAFRILLPYVRGGPGRFEASFTASRGALAEDWSFFLSFGGSRPPSLRMEAPQGSAAGDAALARLGELARSLVPHSCSVRAVARESGRAPFGSGEGPGGLDFDA